jgi:hypothetical protein
MPTTDELLVMVQDLTVRVNAIDGAGLADPTTAQLTVLESKIDGLKTTVNQTFLTVQSLISDLGKKLTDLKTTVYSHLGITL